MAELLLRLWLLSVAAGQSSHVPNFQTEILSTYVPGLLIPVCPEYIQCSPDGPLGLSGLMTSQILLVEDELAQSGQLYVASFNLLHSSVEISRIPHWLGLKGTSGSIWPNPSSSRDTQSMVPRQLLEVPRRRLHSLSGQPVSVFPFTHSALLRTKENYRVHIFQVKVLMLLFP